MKISAHALGKRVREVLDRLDRGEPVTLTCRGRPWAKPVRVDEAEAPGKADAADLSVFGMRRDREDLDDVPAHVRRLRERCRFADRHSRQPVDRGAGERQPLRHRSERGPTGCRKGCTWRAP